MEKIVLINVAPTNQPIDLLKSDSVLKFSLFLFHPDRGMCITLGLSRRSGFAIEYQFSENGVERMWEVTVAYSIIRFCCCRCR